MKKNPITDIVKAASSTKNPTKEFTILIELYQGKIDFDYKDMLWLWNYCSEFLSSAEYQLMCESIFREKIIRQYKKREDKALWRSALESRNILELINLFKEYFKRNNLDKEIAEKYMLKFEANMESIKDNIIKEIKKLSKHSENAAKIESAALINTMGTFESINSYGRTAAKA